MGSLSLHHLFIFCSSLMIFSSSFGAAVDTLSSGQSIVDGEANITLVSSGQSFELGFFSPGISNNRYLGIWYKTIPDTVVWVANRDDPIPGRYGILTFTGDGNLVILNRSNISIWSSNLSRTLKNPVIQLLDTGNIVLRDSGDDRNMWQSFDHPSDTLLPGMILGKNLLTGFETNLTSWKSSDDPAHGDYVCRLVTQGMPQFEVVSTWPVLAIKYRSGPQTGVQLTDTPMWPSLVSKPEMVDNETGFYFWYESVSNDYITRITMDYSGQLQRLVAVRGGADWGEVSSVPHDPCDDYGKCGSNSICSVSSPVPCKCLIGFEPRLAEQWQLYNWSTGCKRKTEMNCSAKQGDKFATISGVRLPEMSEYLLNMNMALDECRNRCLKNCSCTAYTKAKIKGVTGCIMWFGDLLNIRYLQEDGYDQVIYVRVPPSELGSGDAAKKRKRIMIIIILGVSSAVLCFIILALITWSFIRRGRIERIGQRSGKGDIDLPLLDLATISFATNDFAESNLIGAGGFGPVYKGSLPNGQNIAVKRLLSSSGQGTDEFMTEVVLIARLQHRNLVGLLGCCFEKEERMLVYEYMPNESLDHFIFDHDRGCLLGWTKRFDIIVGIARGLLYLHQDSKLQIIHRDLKASNILLDEEMNPKISDFGIARIFQGDENEGRTKRVIGTYGYMSPEYAFDGEFSVKSDVYSFGVLLLEMISSKRNRGFCHPDHHHNLLGHAWLLWTEGSALKLVDRSLYESLNEHQARRCIHVGLLCVQKFPEDRPAMSYVVSMLVTEAAILSQPKQPGFFMERSTMKSLLSSPDRTVFSSNDITITMPVGR